MRVLQCSQSCCMMTCQIHLKSEQESKYLTTLMALFRYFLYWTAYPFCLDVCVTHLLQRRLLSLKQNRLDWVIKTYFSQNTNQQTVFLLSSKSPRKRHIQGVLLATRLWLLLLMGGPQGVQKRCSTVAQPGTSAKFNTVLLQYWMAPPNRPEVGNSEQMQFLWICSLLGVYLTFFHLFIWSYWVLTQPKKGSSSRAEKSKSNILWKTETVGAVQPGEEKAPGRLSSSLSMYNGGL